jgi:hypothetical protein
MVYVGETINEGAGAFFRVTQSMRLQSVRVFPDP